MNQNEFCPTFHGIRLTIGFALALLGGILIALPALAQTQPIVVCCGSGSGGGSGDVTGESESVDGELALFSGITGKDLKRATGTGIAYSTAGVFSVFSNSAGLATAIGDESGTGFVVFNNSATLITPTIASFVNAPHSHENAAGGGVLTTAAIAGLAPSATTDALNASNISSGTLGAARLPALSGGDVTSSAGSAVLSIEANSVALGTDTTGGYAGSSTEGGSAVTADALSANPTDCSANNFANAIAANGDLTCTAIADADVPNTITVDNAATADALAANGTNCSAGNYALGVDASGNAEDCTAIGGGSIGGSTGATDNAVLRADGTGGATIQSSGVTISDTGLITTTGGISSTQGAASPLAQVFGATNTCTGADAVCVGNQITLPAFGSVAVGSRLTATTTGFGMVNIGIANNCGGGNGAIVIGNGSTCGSSNAVSNKVLGYNSSAANNASSSIIIGDNISTTTAGNANIILGVDSASNIAVSNTFLAIGVSKMIMGKGVTNATPAAFTFATTASTAVSNNAGSSIIFEPGAPTGNAAPPDTTFRSTVQGSSGTTSQTVIDRAKIVGRCVALTDEAANNVIEVTLQSASMSAGAVSWGLVSTDGTDHQSLAGITRWNAVNKAGTYSTNAKDVDPGTCACSGASTLTTAWSVANGTNAVTLQVTPTSSLTPSSMKLCYQVQNNSESPIATYY